MVEPHGGAGGIAARGQIYMGAPICVVEIHLQLEIAATVRLYWSRRWISRTL